MAAASPPRWDSEQFEGDRRESIAIFREERMKEPLEKYLEAIDHFAGVVEDLLEMTVDLTQVFERSEEILTDADLLYAVRYLSGPMISEADLKTLTDDASLAPTVLREDPESRKLILDTVLIGLDRRRFPWVSENRDPTEAERAASVIATAALIATQRVRTERANESAVAKQQAVARALRDAGFAEIPRRAVANRREAPDAGQFCESGMFGTRDADLLVGLWDGRTMPVECKVSNSSENSIKRLNNDTAAKARGWLDDFGQAQTVPVGVISGVFKLRNLEAAQDVGLTIFWAHKLDLMVEWIESTRPT